jgi:transcriptional regulator with XRE-family HTH domain
VNDRQVGELFRAVRRRQGLRQVDVAMVAGLSDATVSQLERGDWRSMSFRTVDRIASALGMRVEVDAWWRGGDGRRLISRSHSLLAASFAGAVAAFDEWTFQPEVSFAVYGERGSIDQLGWHGQTGHLLVVELKTEFTDVNETLATLDRKVRLARRIAREHGWAATRVSCWLIVLECRTNRRHAAEHAALLRAKLPSDGRQLRSFLRNPAEPSFGIAFWTDSTPRRVGHYSSGGKSRIWRSEHVRPARESPGR